MHKKLTELCDSLDQLALVVSNSSTEERTFYESINYLHPAVTRSDLSVIASQLSARIKFANIEEIDEQFAASIIDFPRKLKLLETNTIPQFYGGSGTNAIPAYVLTLNVLNQLLSPILADTDIEEGKKAALKLLKDVRAYKARFDGAIADISEIELKMDKISQAHAAAEALPEDLQSLDSARRKVEAAESVSLSSSAKIESLLNDATAAASAIAGKQLEAEKLIDRCEEAFRITTTKGLAAAFDERAGKLASSMWIWVGGLVVSLVIGGFIGHERFTLISAVLASGDAKLGSVWPHLLLALAAIGGPIWFAWLATKQIGQRFRLAEDYGFKSSVAKSYEGYRREALRLNSELESRLFASALSRLEEPPLRLIETSTHGSPLHELANSKVVKSISGALRDRTVKPSSKGPQESKAEQAE